MRIANEQVCQPLGDQPVEGRMTGGIFIDVEWLWVELAGKADDVGL
jgi:hypothetical protein